MVHGWSPGYRDSYDQLQAHTPGTLVTAWTPGLVNGSGQPVTENFIPLAQALSTADPDSVVLMYSWVDQSATSNDPLQARTAEDATEVNGHRMGAAVSEALGDDFYARGGEVHLIGHSFGANVATGAALSLAIAPRQLTLLDSPEDLLTQLGGAKNDLRYKLPRLDIGRGPGQTFVDNYISLVGTRYEVYPGLEDVVDVKTQPPDPNDFTAAHGFAILWYRDSVLAPGSGVGYAWSPLLGGDQASVGAYYTQPSASAPLTLDEVAGPPDPGARTQLLLSTHPLEPADHAGTGNRPLAVGGDGARTWTLTFSTQETSLWLEFGLELSGRAGDLLTLAVDGRERYQAAVPGGGDGRSLTAAPTGAFVLLWDLGPGDHQLAVTLGGSAGGTPADASTTATFADLRLAGTADIVRNLTVTETNALVVAAIIVLLAVVALLIAFVVWIIRRLLHLGRRVRAHEPDPEPEPAGSPPGG